MTTPHVTEISSTRQSQIRLADVECGAHEHSLRHNYDALTPVDMRAYRSRCAEIRALDARADAARSEY